MPINSVVTGYLSTWYGSVLDESCVTATPEHQHHMCWDASYLYKHVETPLFIAENRFDSNQIEQVLHCPKPYHNNSTKTFLKWFGDTMLEGLAATVQSNKGRAKGDGLFTPSCLSHTGNLCLHGGPTVNGKKIADVLPIWFLKMTRLLLLNIKNSIPATTMKKHGSHVTLTVTVEDFVNIIIAFHLYAQ